MTAMKAEQATGTAPRKGWCNQHHQPRADCPPQDRHVQSFRGADELLDAVKAKAEAMGLSRQDGIEMALEQFAGWHEPGEPWRGPRAVREPRGRWRVPAAAGRSEREVADQILQKRDARIKQEAALKAGLEQDRAALKAAQARAVAAERTAAALASELEDARRRERNRQIVAAVHAGESQASLARKHNLTRERVRQIVSEAGPDGASSQLPEAAPGSAVFLEPGGKPVIAAAVPEVPASRNKRGRR